MMPILVGTSPSGRRSYGERCQLPDRCVCLMLCAAGDAESNANGHREWWPFMVLANERLGFFRNLELEPLVVREILTGGRAVEHETNDANDSDDHDRQDSLAHYPSSLYGWSAGCLQA